MSFWSSYPDDMSSGKGGTDPRVVLVKLSRDMSSGKGGTDPRENLFFGQAIQTTCRLYRVSL